MSFPKFYGVLVQLITNSMCRPNRCLNALVHEYSVSVENCAVIRVGRVTQGTSLLFLFDVKLTKSESCYINSMSRQICRNSRSRFILLQCGHQNDQCLFIPLCVSVRGGRMPNLQCGGSRVGVISFAGCDAG